MEMMNDWWPNYVAIMLVILAGLALLGRLSK
jgi:hypothetical protein